MSKGLNLLRMILAVLVVLTFVVTVGVGCKSTTTSSTSAAETTAAIAETTAAAETVAGEEPIVIGKTVMAKGTTEPDTYKPLKTSYYFYFTYKLIHPWYDAIKVGLDAAVAEYAKQGITIKYDFTAPVLPDAVQQVAMIEAGASKHPDVIGVDVNQIATAVPVMNEIQASGIPMMTFSGGDATKADGCNRICFVGNTDNKGDGAKLAEILAKAINYEGEVACLDGTIGATSHEERIQGFNEVMAKYPNIKVVDRQRDNDDIEKAVSMTENFIQKFPNLKGIWCNNMTNPAGAGRAVVDAGKKGKIVIVGMDHDIRVLDFVVDGTILVAQIQNNYDMGYILIKTAVKVADGGEVGGTIKEERYNVGSTSVYQDKAQEFIDLLYGKK